MSCGVRIVASLEPPINRAMIRQRSAEAKANDGMNVNVNVYVVVKVAVNVLVLVDTDQPGLDQFGHLAGICSRLMAV